MSPAWKDMTGAILTEVETGEATAQVAEGLAMTTEAARTELGTATMARGKTIEATTEIDGITEMDPTIETDATTVTDGRVAMDSMVANNVMDTISTPHWNLGTETDMRVRTEAAAFGTVGTATIEIT